ncbi:pyridoxamine 5'-phosphate oxidase family protein [Amycolatopsis decaplanina]|uniref:Uncharacterized protein n=1 Tax=Amycolatopsis decaplanina DSM 44594 TaxID=1284240 RepID=M2ZMQ3_9PSEU|nr:pyridoxamine 5'-phosphate oxidase family protein [Amycolatopsis decaplanina]EME61674.1 hypothetical protein H074_10895 [Amycolatopsis decaplanina DSM 44594]
MANLDIAIHTSGNVLDGACDHVHRTISRSARRPGGEAAGRPETTAGRGSGLYLRQDGVIIIRSHTGAALMSTVDQVVAYEADHLEPGHHTVSWSVIVTGIMRRIIDPVAVTRYEHLLKPWVPRSMDQMLRIEPTFITAAGLVSGKDGSNRPYHSRGPPARRFQHLRMPVPASPT